MTSAPERAAPGDPGARRLGQILRRATEHLAAHGVDTPRLDAELLLAHALGLSRMQLYTEHDRPLTDAERERVREPRSRRAAREPVAYILGEWGFRRLTLRVDRRALVPRPETEVLVERCLALLAGMDAPRVLDVGVGSGAIALALADEHPGARVTGVDTSRDALALARENAERTGLAVELREGGLEEAEGDWDLVVSNPPYVAAADFESLQPEIRHWEPREALVGDGLHEELARRVRRGRLALEVGDGQAPDVAATLGGLGYDDVRDDARPDRPGARRRGHRRGRWPGSTTSWPRCRRQAGRAPDRHRLRALREPVPRATYIERLLRLKGREPLKPTALVAPDVELLFDCVPELRGRSGRIARALLPGPYTLVLPNPARRFRWLTGSRPDTIGVRVPALDGDAAARARARRRGRGHERELAGGPIRAGSTTSPPRSAPASPRGSTAASCPARRRR